MSRSHWIYILAGFWALLFTVSFVVFALTEPTDSGFTRGLNRADDWFKWQSIALIVAIAAFAYARSSRETLSPLEKRIGYTPITVSAVLLVGLVLLVAGALLFPG